MEVGAKMEDCEIMKIVSPKARTGRKLDFIVHKNINDKWAIVAMHWDGDPVLAIRWFYGPKGNPVSRGYPTWFVIPTSLAEGMISKLGLSPESLDRIKKHLWN